MVTYNPTWSEKEISEFRVDIQLNDGYCPCMRIKDDKTKCVCEDFRNKIKDDTFEGECHCGLYYKTLDNPIDV